MTRGFDSDPGGPSDRGLVVYDEDSHGFVPPSLLWPGRRANDKRTPGSPGKHPIGGPPPVEFSRHAPGADRGILLDRPFGFIDEVRLENAYRAKIGIPVDYPRGREEAGAPQLIDEGRVLVAGARPARPGRAPPQDAKNVGRHRVLRPGVLLLPLGIGSAYPLWAEPGMD